MVIATNRTITHNSDNSGIATDQKRYDLNMMEWTTNICCSLRMGHSHVLQANTEGNDETFNEVHAFPCLLQTRLNTAYGPGLAIESRGPRFILPFCQQTSSECL